MESERDGRKKGGALDRLLLFSLPRVSFLPQTDWEKIFEPFLGQKTVSVALQWSRSLVTLTEEIQPTVFYTLGGICHKPAYSRARLRAQKPQNRCTNIVQVHVQERCWNMCTVFTQTEIHMQSWVKTPFSREICHISVLKAAFLKYICFTFRGIN